MEDYVLVAIKFLTTLGWDSVVNASMQGLMTSDFMLNRFIMKYYSVYIEPN